MYCTQVCEMYCHTTLVYFSNNCSELNENVAKLSIYHKQASEVSTYYVQVFSSS